MATILERAAPLRHVAFRWLLLGRTVAHLGNSIAPIALAFAVLDEFNSVAVLGIVVAARSIANVGVVLLGGVLADRLPGALVLTGSQLLAAATQAVAAVLVISQTASIGLLIALSAVNGAAAAIAFPATSAMVPKVVPKDSLQQANAISRLGLNLAFVGGTAAGGVLIAIAGPGYGLVVDAACFVLAALFFSRLKVSVPASKSTAHVWDELRHGWQEFTLRRWTWLVVLQFCFINAAWVGGTAVLAPAVADASVGRAGWGFAAALFGVGLAAGALLALAWQPARSLAWGAGLCSFLSLPLLVLAVRPTLWLILLAMFIAGVALEQFGVAWDVALQQNVPAERLGKVYSYDALGSYLAIPLGEVSVGPLAERFGTTPTLILCAAVIAVSTILALGSREVRLLRRITALDELDDSHRAV